MTTISIVRDMQIYQLRISLAAVGKKKEENQRKKEEFSVGEHEKYHTTNHKRTFELNETELLVSTAAQSRYLLGR